MGIPSHNRVVILGGGPAGLGAAWQLTRRRLAQVTLLEQQEVVGGNAGSFLLEGMAVDYGSHRLHPSCDPGILRDLRALLGADLLYRPRHGRIRFCGRWIHFPLQPADLLLRLPPGFWLEVLWDTARKPFQRRAATSGETFASVLEAGLGATMCREFYFPYAQKLWGIPPEELSAVQARRRVSAGSPLKMIRKVLAAIPGLKPPGAGHFYYPRQGFGQISQRLCEAARAAGAEFLLGCRVRSVRTEAGRVQAVCCEHNGRLHSLEAFRVWSTLPINLLVRSLEPPAPAEVLQAADSVVFRGMILIYLALKTPRFSEYDAHYFPEESIPVSRVSEPRNYSLAAEPADRTVLCAELPCEVGGPYWRMPAGELGALALDALGRASLPIAAPLLRVETRRLSHAYPVYARSFDPHFARLDSWVGQIQGLLTFGRQGLFVHDNTHHALAMACAAADCLSAAGEFDHQRWAAHRRRFENHVVED